MREKARYEREQTAKSRRLNMRQRAKCEREG